RALPDDFLAHGIGPVWGPLSHAGERLDDGGPRATLDHDECAWVRDGALATGREVQDLEWLLEGRIGRGMPAPSVHRKRRVKRHSSCFVVGKPSSANRAIALSRISLSHAGATAAPLCANARKSAR